MIQYCKKSCKIFAASRTLPREDNFLYSGDSNTDFEKTSLTNCHDSSSFSAICPLWAEQEECIKNPGFMKKHCKKSCNQCPSSTNTVVLLRHILPSTGTENIVEEDII